MACMENGTYDTHSEHDNDTKTEFVPLHIMLLPPSALFLEK